MAADNHTTIVGNLVDDPELRFTNNGIAVANMRVAVTQRIQQDGEWRDGDTSFLKVNVWRGPGRAPSLFCLRDVATLGHIPH
jgi:single-strand DNA-binding protein